MADEMFSPSLPPSPPPVSAALRYAGAFLIGYAGSLFGPLAAGRWPLPTELISAIVPGLLATGLFHASSPKDDAPKDNAPKDNQP